MSNATRDWGAKRSASMQGTRDLGASAQGHDLSWGAPDTRASPRSLRADACARGQNAAQQHKARRHGSVRTIDRRDSHLCRTTAAKILERKDRHYYCHCSCSWLSSFSFLISLLKHDHRTQAHRCRARGPASQTGQATHGPPSYLIQPQSALEPISGPADVARARGGDGDRGMLHRLRTAVASSRGVAAAPSLSPSFTSPGAVEFDRVMRQTCDAAPHRAPSPPPPERRAQQTGTGG